MRGKVGIVEHKTDSVESSSREGASNWKILVRSSHTYYMACDWILEVFRVA